MEALSTPRPCPPTQAAEGSESWVMGMLLLRFSSFFRTVLLLILKVTFLGSNWSVSPPRHRVQVL